jgi:dTDP-4-amino-4,6-dideoxygalactose transaminase
LAHGIGPGDEVITTPFTFIAAANAVLFAGAKPRFVDIDERTYNIDPFLIESAITPRTKAILPVHLFGHPCDIETIMRLAARYDLAVIEDACQSHGASVGDQRVGSFGTGCFSFYPSKNITTGEGGILTTNDPELADRARLIRSHGQRERYYHEVLGFNFRMTEIQAAIGLAQLDRLEEYTRIRRANAAYLSERLTGVVVPYETPGCRHVYHQYTVRVPHDRDGLAERLRQLEIATGVYYPLPVHQQQVYKRVGYTGHLPQAEKASREVLSLPVHPALRPEDLDAIVAGVNGQ